VALKDKLVGAITAAPEDPTRPRKDSKYLTDEYLDRRIREAQAYIAETQPAGNDCIFTDEIRRMRWSLSWRKAMRLAFIMLRTLQNLT